MKKIIFGTVLLLVCQFAFGQDRDEFFRPSDPAKSVQIYPNPAVDYLTIKFEAPVAKTSRLDFRSIIGSSIELEQETIDEFEIKVRVKDLPVGYYILAVHNPLNNTRGIYKFLKR
ncbi:MAG: hypothetical protein OJF59_000365 [Cytophagales bacterium]|jgi:hypothetical protein|nr:hypothetical protein [Bacteroidota bacterium]MBS1981151.1 hypothetical protein [Bacteroidota bacterium]WHZ06612.1 MAG: hypothetical protein OJF59_000365 [Cytophagales bacterium]